MVGIFLSGVPVVRSLPALNGRDGVVIIIVRLHTHHTTYPIRRENNIIIISP